MWNIYSKNYLLATYNSNLTWCPDIIWQLYTSKMLWRRTKVPQWTAPAESPATTNNNGPCEWLDVPAEWELQMTAAPGDKYHMEQKTT